MTLAAYACHPQRTRGRRHLEPPAPTRHDHQRDRDRIVHSSAFRRLVYKTQVFLNHEGDLFRTRMTHSLEVAQIGRSVARLLALNEDLVEAIALAHDLGHTPFGHAGQDALNEAMHAADPHSAGFEHNLQSLRVVDELEERYPRFDGLNLTFETREGILKHCSLRNAERLVDLEPGGVAQRFIDRTQPSLEAQVCNLADEVAYNAHDMDDGVRSGLLTLAQMREVALLARFHDETVAEHPGLVERRVLFETLRRMVSEQVYDLVAATQAALRDAAPQDAADVRRAPPLAQFSAGMRKDAAELKQFLRHNLYRHPQVVSTTAKAKVVVRELFEIYLADPRTAPALLANRDGDRTRAVADYLAGMTDRYALKEHQRLTGRCLFQG